MIDWTKYTEPYNHHVKTAREHFQQGYNCCQSVLAAFAMEFGLDQAQVRKMTTGFAGGLAYHGETCGAVIGAYLVIGLYAGANFANDDIRKQRTYQLIEEYLREFAAIYAVTKCKELLNIQADTPKGFEQAIRTATCETICSGLVEDSARILANLVQADPHLTSSEYFDSIAQNWDEMRKDLFSESVRVEILREALFENDMVVADIGAGTGFLTEGLINYPVTVLAIDQADRMLENMRQKFSGEKQVILLKCNRDKLPIADGFVDYAFANMYLHHVDDPLGAFGEINRILKPGGILILTDMERHTNQSLKRDLHDRWMGFDRKDLLVWVRDTGFDQINIRRTGETCCSDTIYKKDPEEIQIFLLKAVKRR